MIKTKEKWTKFISVPVDVFPEELKKAVQKALLSQLTLPKSSNRRLRQCHRHVRTFRPSLVAPALGGGCEVQTWGRQTTEHVELPPTTEPTICHNAELPQIVLFLVRDNQLYYGFQTLISW